MIQTALDFTAARARADIGIQRASTRANKLVPGWTDRAAEALRDFARTAAGTFTIERARESAASQLDEPPDGRAWGHATRRAVALGYIDPTGDYAPAASSNGSPKRLYRAGRNA